MSAKEYAVQDIKDDLMKEKRSFLAFRKELNPVMRRLVSRQIKDQIILNPYPTPSHSNSQLVAHCFFSKGKVRLNNYAKYYD